MIATVKKLIKQVFIPKSEFEEDKIECAIDEEKVDCTELSSPYLGVPAPVYLPEDPWFSTPVFSEKQLSVKEAHDQAVADQQILDESQSKESADIHQKLYELASKNWNTVDETQFAAQGGSENFQEDSNTWQSGTGLGQFR
jgi:hypothetical protein